MKKLLITIPCHNEELILEKNIQEILNYNQKEFSNYDWRVLIIDNASEDNTYQIAKSLSGQNPRIMAAQWSEKGRGSALRNIWSQYSDHDIYSYMDIDLATDLKDFKNLVAHVEDGHDIVTGSRYVAGADVKRVPKREFLSKTYNLLLKIFFNVKFKDAQCGFKAFKGESLPVLLSFAKDNGWFWDTELMIYGERNGYKIKEIPVCWREIRDELRKSKVSPFVEIVRQLKNIWNLRKRI